MSAQGSVSRCSKRGGADSGTCCSNDGYDGIGDLPRRDGEHCADDRFVDRFARAIGRRVVVAFGPSPLTPEQRLDHVRRVYLGSLVWRGKRYFPEPVDLILRRWIDLEPEELYCKMLDRAERRLDEGIPLNVDERTDHELRGPVAVAAMYHDVIDWRIVRRKRFASQKKLDERVVDEPGQSSPACLGSRRTCERSRSPPSRPSGAAVSRSAYFPSVAGQGMVTPGP